MMYADRFHCPVADGDKRLVRLAGRFPSSAVLRPQGGLGVTLKHLYCGADAAEHLRAA